MKIRREQKAFLYQVSFVEKKRRRKRKVFGNAVRRGATTALIVCVRSQLLHLEKIRLSWGIKWSEFFCYYCLRSKIFHQTVVLYVN